MITDQMPDSPAAAVEDYSSVYVDKTIETLSKASESFELDKLAQELGMGDVFKQMTKDRVKIIFSALGAFYVMTLLKRNILKVAVIGGAGFLALKNKDYLKTLFNKESYLESKLPIEHEEPVAPVILVDSSNAPLLEANEEDIAKEDTTIS